MYTYMYVCVCERQSPRDDVYIGGKERGAPSLMDTAGPCSEFRKANEDPARASERLCFYHRAAAAAASADTRSSSLRFE